MRSAFVWLLVICLVLSSVALYVGVNRPVDVELGEVAVRETSIESGVDARDSERALPVKGVDEPVHPSAGPIGVDVTQLPPDEILKLLEAREITARDLMVLSDQVLDELAILRSKTLLAGWTPATRESALDTLSKLPSQLPNPKGKSLSEADIKHLDSMRGRYAKSISALAEEAFHELEAHKQSLWAMRQGVSLRREGEAPPSIDESSHGKFRSSQECGMLGRYVRFEYSSHGSDALESKLALIEELRSSLVSEQSNYIESLP